MTDQRGQPSPRSFTFGPFVLVPGRQLLLRGDTPVRIGNRALDILTALVERPGELVSKRELLARVWPSTYVDESNLKVNMVAIRRALGTDGSTPDYIATDTGRGYRFVAPVKSFDATEPAAIVSPALSRNHDLPSTTTRIFGRAGAIKAIVEELGRARLVTIAGSGGTGKTTVAIAAARAASKQFADGAAFIDFATIDDPGFVPPIIASALGLGVTGGDPLSTVVLALKQQTKLLVFDNCEHLLPAVAAAVDRLGRNLDGLRILATSREPLRLREERVFRLRGLECDPSESPAADEARRYPAIELFDARASEQTGFRLTDTDAPAVAEICRRLDGNALAIELAATQTAEFTPAQILKMLDDRFHLLAPDLPGASHRHQSLLATLDWSYGLLSENEARLLRAVSVFARSFSIEGATAVSDSAPAEVVDTLAQLTAKSLLAMDAVADLATYRLLETPRAYCLDRLRLIGEDKIVRCRHAEHVCAILEQAAKEWSQRPAQEWSAAYYHVLDDLRIALAWVGRDEEHRSLRIRLIVAGLLLWNHFSLIQECHAHVSRAVQEIDAAGLGGTAFEMKFKLWLAGSTMITRGLKPEALVALRRAWDIANEMGDTDYRHRCLMLIAAYELFTGRHDAGMRTIETFASAAAAEDPSILPEGEVHLGIAELFLGRLRNAQRRLEALRQHDLRYFNRSYTVRYMADIGVLLDCALSQVLWLRGFPDTAARTATAAYEKARPAHHHLSLNNALTYSCPVFYWSGRHAECDRYVGMLAEHVARQGLVTRRPIALFYRAASAQAQGDATFDVIGGLQQAIAEFREFNYLARMPYYLGVLADAFASHGRLEDAHKALDSAFDCAVEQNERWCLPELLRIRSTVLIASSREEEAEAILLESIACAQEIGALSWRLRSATDLAKVWRARSRVDEAYKMLLPVYREFTEGFETHDLVAAAGLLASLERPGSGEAA